jgi:hypothetical protein
MMNFSKNDLSKAQKGDQLWNYFEQRWETVEEVNPNYEYSIAFEGKNNCDFNGRELACDVVPTYFWNEIHFDIPERPKRKVKKTLEWWINCYPEGQLGIHESKKSADSVLSPKRIGEAVHIVKEYEIEE